MRRETSGHETVRDEPSVQEADRPMAGAAGAARVFLIGLPGAGKSTVGRALATALGWPFLDLDAEIERATGRTIADIFETEGEVAFRRLEAATLRLVGSAEPLVLATGGGTPCFHESLDWLLAHGRVVWLDVAPATSARRLAADATARPLLAAARRATPEATAEALTALLKQTLAARAPFYARAPWRLTENEPDAVGVLRQRLGL